MTDQPPIYDGFISYSHAADDLLAPRLQAGLQKFAKPWWKRRAVRIFRDESSLSANPHLWSSITEALDTSGWFVLLLSPDAAQSEWVNQEIAYWVETRDQKKILPVLTDGDFGWVDGEAVGSAVPPALRGVFEAEPRWVDLRFAKGEEQLDLSNPSFAAAVADVAAALRGVPKDELESEEVRQWRRTRRTASAAAALLLILALAATWAGVSSARNAELARAARGEAERNTEVALEAERLAQEEAERADRTARRLVDFVSELETNEVDPPPPDFFQAGLPPVELELVAAPPSSVRLDFLQDNCQGGACFRLAGFIDADRGYRTGPNPFNYDARGPTQDGSGWVAGEPFHIRHGFPNPSLVPLDDLRASGYSVVLYVRREAGPEGGGFKLGRTYLVFAQEVVRETTRSCGSEYRELLDPVTCDRWVFDFPDGLPAGRYDLWVEWQAPCEAWVESDVCPSPTLPLSLFASGVSMTFFGEDYLVGDAPRAVPWPFDPWVYAEPIPGWEGNG